VGAGPSDIAAILRGEDMFLEVAELDLIARDSRLQPAGGGDVVRDEGCPDRCAVWDSQQRKDQ
jgi:hypothetical protein